MITLKELAARLEDKLNGEFIQDKCEYSNILDYGLLGFHKNTRYEFCIRADEMEYREAERRENTNTVTVYICGVLKPIAGSEIEGTSPDTYNTNINATLELLIPGCDDTMTVEIEDESGNVELDTVRLSDVVQQLINTVCGASQSEYVKGSDGIMYYLGTRYSRTDTGAKEIRGRAGISLPVTLYVSYAVVSTGISSDDIILKVGGDRVYFTRFGAARESISEGNISSASSNGASAAVASGTALTLSFDSPTRLTAVGEAMIDYLLYGKLTPMDVTLTIPSNQDEEGSKTGEYSMIFASVGLNAELNLAASSEIRLVEVMPMEGENTDG